MVPIQLLEIVLFVFFLAFINTLYIYFKILYGFKILPKNTQKEQLFYRILLVFCEELFGKVFS